MEKIKKPKGTPNNNNKWKIAYSNDEFFTGHKKSRPVVIVADNGKNVKVKRITSIEGKEEKMKKGYIIPIGSYKSLESKSAVDKTVYSKNLQTGQKLTTRDEKVFREVKNEKLRVCDRRKVTRLRNRKNK